MSTEQPAERMSAERMTWLRSLDNPYANELLDEIKALEAERNEALGRVECEVATKNGMEIAYLATVKGWQELHDNSIIRNRELKLERDAAIEARKHTQDWYGSRWERMSRWFRERMKGTEAEHEWFNIVANGSAGRDEPPVSFMAEVNMSRFAVERQKAEIQTLRAELNDAMLALSSVPLESVRHSDYRWTRITETLKSERDAAIAERDALRAALEQLRKHYTLIAGPSAYPLSGIGRIIEKALEAQSNGTK